MKRSATPGMPIAHFDENARGMFQPDPLLGLQEAFPSDGAADEWTARPPCSVATAGATHSAVEMFPADTARRRALMGHGMAAECVQCPSRGIVKYRFNAPVHLLVAYEEGESREGETFVESLPRSTLRSFARKFTFVPAGHEYHAWYDPRTKHNLIHFYFDLTRLENGSRLQSTDTALLPRLFFEDAALWSPILKLKSVVEDPATDDRSYFEALGTVLILELERLNRGKRAFEPPTRGGLAAWQQRVVTAYIEQHLAEGIPLGTLADLARLSPHHFCRSFKRSLGKPPHRYQLDRRIERAKLLLAKPTVSVTDVALTLGFSGSSAFATAFRKATGITPSTYRRS